MSDGLPDPDEARQRIIDNHDLQADTEEAKELLVEAVELWDDLEDKGRVARIRQANDILRRSLEAQRIAVEAAAEGDHYCPDCGSTEISHEDMGYGDRRLYCTACDATLQVG